MTRLPTFIRRAAASAVGAALVVLMTAPAALAHDRLKDSSPANNAKLAHLETIELEFTSRMTLPTVVLDGPNGKQVPLDKPRSEGSKVFARPSEALGPGRYRIAWRVVSSDGHPIDGEISFTITAPAPSPSTSPSTTATAPATAASTADAEPASQPASSAAATRSTDSSGVPGWLWIALAVLVAAGAAVLLAARRKRDSS
ncbi:copper resistance protein CopC [Nonomuraea sp. NPDC000554]|uniref:copper resistance CopC family protein n=1 Tax=Nonomuraea sp. NPDC000554 TaxID=3154259 RepID=UPI003330BA68